MAGFSVSGYDVVELIGFGATGEVWLARERVTGAPVALKRLRSPCDLAARDRLRREAAVLAGVSHPHVVRLQALTSSGDELVLVLDHAAGGSLAGLLAARGRLAAGEVVTVATPIAEALAAAHACGVLHGDVKPANVLFTADGRPLLADLGVARLVGEPVLAVDGTVGYLDPAVVGGAAPVAESDVYALAAVCFAALTGGAPAVDGTRRPLAELAPDTPSALVQVIEAGLEHDPARRPTAAELAAAVFAACPARPVLPAVRGTEHGGVDGLCEVVPTHRVRADPNADPDADSKADPPRPAGAARRSHRASGAASQLFRGRWRVVAAGLAALSGVVMAALTGLAWAGTGESGAAGVRAARLHPSATTVSTSAATSVTRAAASTGPATTSSTIRWRRVLGGLDAARSAAFARAGPAALDGVYAAGAPALARDRALLAGLARSGARARALRLDVKWVRVVSATGRRVVLRVVDVLRPYDVVLPDGRIESRPGRGRQSWLVTLVGAGARWRVYEVTVA